MERVKREEFFYQYDSYGYTIRFRGVAIESCGIFSQTRKRQKSFWENNATKELDKIIRICNGEHWDYYRQYHPYCRIAAIIENEDNNK